MFTDIEERLETETEPFSGELLGPKNWKNLSKELLALLIEYYNNAYNYSFKLLSDRDISIS